MAANASVIEKPVKKTRQPMQKGGRFGTSEAAKKRKAEGIEQVSGTNGLTSGIATSIGRQAPGIAPEQRTEMARHIAGAATIGRELTVAVLDKIKQSLKKNESLRIIIDTSPEASKYVQRLVRGEEEGAPHAIRLQAALAVIELSGIRIQAAVDDRDLSELSLEELNQKVMQMEHRIDVATSLPGESERIEAEVGNAAPLRTVSRETSETASPTQRQAIE